MKSYLAAMFLSIGAASTCDTLREWGDANNILVGAAFNTDMNINADGSY